jgi:hypothetical protein
MPLPSAPAAPGQRLRTRDTGGGVRAVWGAAVTIPDLTDTLLSLPNAPHFVPACDLSETVHRVKLELERRRLWHCVKGVRKDDGAMLTIMLEHSGTNYESMWREPRTNKAMVQF